MFCQMLPTKFNNFFSNSPINIPVNISLISLFRSASFSSCIRLTKLSLSVCCTNNCCNNCQNNNKKQQQLTSHFPITLMCHLPLVFVSAVEYAALLLSSHFFRPPTVPVPIIDPYAIYRCLLYYRFRPLAPRCVRSLKKY